MAGIRDLSTFKNEPNYRLYEVGAVNLIEQMLLKIPGLNLLQPVAMPILNKSQDKIRRTIDANTKKAQKAHKKAAHVLRNEKTKSSSSRKKLKGPSSGKRNSKKKKPVHNR